MVSDKRYGQPSNPTDCIQRYNPQYRQDPAKKSLQIKYKQKLLEEKNWRISIYRRPVIDQDHISWPLSPKGDEKSQYN